MKKIYLYLFLFFIFFIPVIVNAKDFRDTELNEGDRFKSGDIIGNNTYMGYEIPVVTFSRVVISGYGSFEPSTVKVKFYGLLDGSTKDNLNYNLFEEYEYGYCNRFSSIYATCYEEYYNDIDLPQKDEKDVMWDLNNLEVENNYVSGGSYRYASFVSMDFYEVFHDAPELKLTCENNQLMVGESTNCKLSAFSDLEITAVRFDLKSDYLVMSDLDISEGWAIEKNDDVYTISFDGSGETLNNEFEIVKFNAEATKRLSNDEIVSTLRITDFEYTDDLGDNVVNEYSVDINIKNTSNLKNPTTSRFRYILLVLVFILFGFSITYVFKNKNII